MLKKAAARLKAVPIETGNAGFRLGIIPYPPMQVILREGDDEFPPEANILFDSAIGDYLSPEDVAWLASLPCIAGPCRGNSTHQRAAGSTGSPFAFHNPHPSMR